MEGRYTKHAAIATLVLVAMVANTADAQCGMSQGGFDACRPAVTKTRDGSTPPNPSEDCCKAVGGANLQCLCTFANSPLLGTFNIDKNAAMRLPVTCNVNPNFHC